MKKLVDSYSMAVGVVIIDNRSFHFVKGPMYDEQVVKISARAF